MLNNISTANQLCQYWPRVLSGNAVFSDPHRLVFIGSQGHYGLGIVLENRKEPLPLQIDIIYNKNSVPQGGFTQGTIFDSGSYLWVWTGEEPTQILPNNSISGWVKIKKGEGRQFKAGGLWIYDNEIDVIEEGAENGQFVKVVDFDDYPLGVGFINTNSKIIGSIIYCIRILYNIYEKWTSTCFRS